MHHDTPFIAIIAFGFGLSYFFGMIANHLRLSPLIGYLTAGVLLGPHVTFFYDADLTLANEISEVGVMLIMFGVGLHFSIKDLKAVKNIAVPGAILQIIGTITVAIIIGYIFGYNVFQSAIFGLCVSVASTVVLLRSLEQFNVLETPRGKIAVGWLIVEDLITVLILVILPTMQFVTSGESFNVANFLNDIFWTAVKLLSFVAVMFYLGRIIIPFTISRSAATGSRELFTLSVLALALGIAYLAVSVFNVSFALGAFFAGMIMHESDLAHRAAEDTLPLRDAFAVLFFVAVGMLFDWHILFNNILGVIYTTSLILLINSSLAYILIRLMGKSNRTALTVAVSVAQIGEFSFILAALSVNYGYITPEQKDLVLAGAIISIILNPFLFSAVEKLLAFLDLRVKHALRIEQAQKTVGPLPPEEFKSEVSEEKMIEGPISLIPLTEEELEKKMEADHEFENDRLLLKDHYIVVGYAVVGKIIVQQMRDENHSVMVITNKLEEFYELNGKGIPAIFGDFKDHEHFIESNVGYAKGIIFTMERPYEVGACVDKLFNEHPDLFEDEHFVVTAMASFDDEIEFLHTHHVENVISLREVASSALFGTTIARCDENHSMISTDNIISYRPRKNKFFLASLKEAEEKKANETSGEAETIKVEEANKTGIAKESVKGKEDETAKAVETETTKREKTLASDSTEEAHSSHNHKDKKSERKTPKASLSIEEMIEAEVAEAEASEEAEASALENAKAYLNDEKDKN